MKNRNVGWLIIGIAIIIGILVFIFNYTIKDAIGLTCSHGPSCSMYDFLRVQTWISLSIVGLIIVIGLFLIFMKEEKETIIKKVKEKVQVTRKPIDYSKLNKEEKILAKIIEEAQGTIFQSDLVEKSGFGKVKVTRILDRLESRSFIERKRRGMTNIVILK